MSGDNTTGWKVATIVAVVMGLVLAGVVYVLMDLRAQDLIDELEAATSTATSLDVATTVAPTTVATTSSGPATSGSTTETTIGSVDDELSRMFEDVLGEDAGALLDELVGGGLGGDLGGLTGGLDASVMECLTPESMDFGGESDIPEGEVGTQVEAIADLVAEDRGISTDGALDVEFVSREEVARRVRQLTEEELDPEVVDYQTRLYRALGAITGERNVGEIQLDALDASVGGFYDPDTGELVIGSEEIDPLGALVVAHEVQHAVADDVLGLPDLEAIDEQQGGDAALAALALVEGDASLISQQFMMEHMSFDDLLAVTMTSMEASESLSDIPHHLRRILEFPYLEGLGYVCGLTIDGGWEQVDAAYDDPPATTAEVLFADFRGEEVVDVPDPGTPQGWTEVDADAFGAAELMFLLEAPGGDTSVALSDPKQRVESWSGGEVTVWERGEDTAVGLRLAEGEGPTSLCEMINDFYGAAFPQASASGERSFDGEGQDARVSCGDGIVTLGIAPDMATASAIAEG